MPVFPDYLVQEIGVTVATLCREIVMSKHSDGATTEKQQEIMEELFHGSAGYQSVLDQFMHWKGSFQAMFNMLPIEINREGNELRREDLPSLHVFLLALCMCHPKVQE
jgi:hypothetical protein